ncbi:MAG: hypothetical protein U0Q07_09500 [Acidimicrobiales bacterium]
MARDRRGRAGAADAAEDQHDEPEAGAEPAGRATDDPERETAPTSADPAAAPAATDGPDHAGDADAVGLSSIPEEEVEAADQAVAEAIARYSSPARLESPREQAVRHAARESMAAIEKFLGLARAAGSPGREPVWVGRVLKHRVKAWQLVYDFDADFSYVARMDRGIYLTKKGKLLFTVADSKPLRRRVAWKTDHASLDVFLARYTGEHEATKVPMLHHRRLLDGIARVCAEQRLDWG